MTVCPVKVPMFLLTFLNIFVLAKLHLTSLRLSTRHLRVNIKFVSLGFSVLVRNAGHNTNFFVPKIDNGDCRKHHQAGNY